MDNGNKVTKWVLFGFLLIFTIIFAIALSGNDVLSFAKALFAQFLFAGFCYLMYFTHKNLYPIFTQKNLGFSVIIGIGFGLAWVFLGSIVPGLSVGVTLYPQSVSSGMSWFIVNIVSPVIESIFAFGAILGLLYGTKFGKKHEILSVIIVGAFISLLHLGAYVYGIANLNFFQAVGAFSGNFGAFLSAFIFFTISGFLVAWKKVHMLIGIIIAHAIVNFSQYTKSVAVFG